MRVPDPRSAPACLVPFRRGWRFAVLSLVALVALSECDRTYPRSTERPLDEVRVVRLAGSPRERGLEHGRALSNEIRYLYYKFLDQQLLPYLNREQPFIAKYFSYYKTEKFQNGRFSYELLKEAAHSMSASLPPEALEEIQGITDGSGMAYDDVLILNTFLDGLLSVLNIRAFLQYVEAPFVTEIRFPESLLRDGVDNDEDGEIDEPGENVITPYVTSVHPVVKGVPEDGSIELHFHDFALGKVEGVDIASARVLVDGVEMRRGAPGWEDGGSPRDAWIRIRPAGGLPRAERVSLVVNVADLAWETDPPPGHANNARMERLSFFTEGADGTLAGGWNTSKPVQTEVAQSVAFAAAGPMTTTGEILVGRHFALLDIGVAHLVPVLFAYEPDDPSELRHIALSWAGVGWALSGMNEAGLVVAVHRSESLDDSTVGNILQLKIRPEGTPIGYVMREALARARTVDEAQRIIASFPSVTGWSMVLADADRRMRLVERDSNVLRTEDGGLFSAGPGEVPSFVSSSGTFQLNDPDFALPLLDGVDALRRFEVQRGWAPFFFDSLDSWRSVTDAAKGAGRPLDVEGMIGILRTPEVLNKTDSMHAAVFRPETREAWIAMGVVPAAKGRFEHFAFEDLFRSPAEAR